MERCGTSARLPDKIMDKKAHPLCGGVSENEPHTLIGHGAVRRCGLVGRRVPLEVGSELSDAQARPSGSLFFLLLMDPEVTLSYIFSTLPPCLQVSSK